MEEKDILVNAFQVLCQMDLVVAQRELEWTENHLAETPDMPQIAEAWKEVVEQLTD